MASIFSTLSLSHFNFERLPLHISSWYCSNLTVSAFKHRKRTSFVSREQNASDWKCFSGIDLAKSFSNHLWKLQSQFCLNSSSVNWHFSLIDLKLSGWTFVNELCLKMHSTLPNVDVGFSKDIVSKIPNVLLRILTLCHSLDFSQSRPRILNLLWAIDSLLPAKSIALISTVLTLK